jgi:hypothetical protein
VEESKNIFRRVCEAQKVSDKDFFLLNGFKNYNRASLKTSVIASEAKQSPEYEPKRGLLRRSAPRNDIRFEILEMPNRKILRL